MLGFMCAGKNNRNKHKSVTLWCWRLCVCVLCVGNEGFFLFLYMLHFDNGWLINLPYFGETQPSVIYMYIYDTYISLCVCVGETGFFVVATAACAPVMFVKQVLSVIQW